MSGAASAQKSHRDSHGHPVLMFSAGMDDEAARLAIFYILCRTDDIVHCDKYLI
jgi:hypothetical protein